MTIASATMGIDDFRRAALPRIADALAGGIAASLPWSTSVTGIRSGSYWCGVGDIAQGLLSYARIFFI
jgi:hypothetical protein